MNSVLPYIELSIRDNADACVILLHGLGADGNDLGPVAEQLSISASLSIRFLFPNAAMQPVTINNGYVMPAWYDILQSNFCAMEDESGIRASQAAINQLVLNEHQRGINFERIILAGFSQGGAIALQTALRFPQRLGGVIALSTYLPLRAKLLKEHALINEKLPIFFGHGRFDSIVPFTEAIDSRDLLEAQGYPVEWHEYSMDHTICEEEITDISEWLTKVLVTKTDVT